MMIEIWPGAAHAKARICVILKGLPMMLMLLMMLMMLMMLIAMLRQGLAVQSRHLGRTTRINPPSYNPSWAPQGTASHISYLLAPPGPRALYAIKFASFFSQ